MKTPEPIVFRLRFGPLCLCTVKKNFHPNNGEQPCPPPFVMHYNKGTR